MNNNNISHLRVYDEKLNLLYDFDTGEKNQLSSLKSLLSKCQPFLQVDNMICYRLVPEL